MEDARHILEQFIGVDSQPPVSFALGSLTSHELLPAWNRTASTSDAGNGVTLHRLDYRDPAEGLALTLEIKEYAGFPAIEWVMRFSNEGTCDTPILQDVQVIDLGLPVEQPPVLSCLRGCTDSKDDFAEIRQVIRPSWRRRIGSCGGRSSCGKDNNRQDGVMPVFELQLGEDILICAVGWSGQWAADISYLDGEVRLQAGMDHTHLRLRPGESIRTPSILLFLAGNDPDEAHNAYRRFILRHHTPLRNGDPVPCPIAACSWFGHDMGMGVTEENQLTFIDDFVNAGIGIDAFWLDAGWFEGRTHWRDGAGNWFPKKRAFPNGLGPIRDRLKQHGLGFVLWFEPERVYPGTWLYENHPEWVIAIEGATEALVDFGNQEAVKWMTDHISSMIAEHGVTVYRQDFNLDPLEYWSSADAPDRQGFTQARHIEGLYAFWDELRRRHPDLVIDNCASGGCRLDIEAGCRAVPLWREDYAFEPEGAQSHMLSLHRYWPVHATAVKKTDAYNARSSYGNGLVFSAGPGDEGFDIESARLRVSELKQLRPLFTGDCYPLTSHSAASDVWCGYQFLRADLARGAAMFFRRRHCPHAQGRFKLRGLEPEGLYELAWHDSGKQLTASGEALMQDGVDVTIGPAPGSEIVAYTWVSASPARIVTHSRYS